jgi:hypothetical protein
MTNNEFMRKITAEEFAYCEQIRLRQGLRPAAQDPNSASQMQEILFKSVSALWTAPVRNVAVPAKCECGSAAVGSPRHSDWCPLHA